MVFETLKREQSKIVDDLEKVLSRLKTNGGEISIYVNDKENDYFHQLSEMAAETGQRRSRLNWLFTLIGFVFGIVVGVITMFYVFGSSSIST